MNIEESAERVKKWCEFYRLREKTNIDFLFSIAEKDIPIQAIETLLTAYEKEKEKNKEHKEKIIYWLDRLDFEEALQDEYDELYGCQAAVKILKQLLKEE